MSNTHRRTRLSSDNGAAFRTGLVCFDLSPLSRAHFSKEKCKCCGRRIGFRTRISIRCCYCAPMPLALLSGGESHILADLLSTLSQGSSIRLGMVCLMVIDHFQRALFDSLSGASVFKHIRWSSLLQKCTAGEGKHARRSSGPHGWNHS